MNSRVEGAALEVAAAGPKPAWPFVLAAVAALVVGAIAFFGYPAAIIVGLAGTGAALSSLVILTAADMFRKN